MEIYNDMISELNQINSPQNSYPQTIVSIDVGIINLGLVICSLTKEHPVTIERIEDCKLINIKDITINCNNPNCTLKHESGSAIDWVNHFIQLYRHNLEQASHILIEKQPPGGLQHIEVLLTQHFRDKVTLIFPRTLHKWMGISKLSYDDRKEQTQIRAQNYLTTQKDWIQIPDRRHDMADALCFILYFLYEKDRVTRLEEQLAQQKLLVENSIGRKIEHFAYHYPESGYESGNENGSESGSERGNESDTEDYLQNVTTTKPDMCNFCGTIDEDSIVEHKRSGSVICMNCGTTLCWTTKIPHNSENGEVPPPEIESFRYNLKGFNHF